ncbi:MucB/RseB C-terminal domain-containing protein [Pseudomonas sp. CAN2814]|uniref:MucB/RseB C-terminal domain-containing protein n=1 Tax=Pseudomonas sp. CAN1 TaxID=3046726 RepID=UPI0026494F1D|nr:MucB/RseB C-terminal domain-containing protein [Pseudomonas sp. CAN1]MDN6859606.1 MucB/RseB C-terminal domain-containing protein [Pseudomonas sp. CAN1]
MRATTALLFFLGGLLALPVQAADALDWIKRLSEADQKQNFQGTFIYERSGAFTTHDVWHRVETDGSVREHLVQVDGPRQEVVRVDGATQCVGGGMAGQASTGEMWPARKLNPTDLSAYYDVRVAGESRIADRPAVVLAVIPRDQHRYGFELHVDKETGLPLKSLLLNDKGQIIERLQFTRIDLSAPDDGELQPTAACKPVKETKVAEVKTGWHSEWVPPGFTLNSTLQERSPVSNDQVLCLAYGDGLARFSVFLEPLHGAKVDDARTQLGPTTVVSRRFASDDGGTMVTVVGEIPSGTAERVALSMRPTGAQPQ